MYVTKGTVTREISQAITIWQEFVFEDFFLNCISLQKATERVKCSATACLVCHQMAQEGWGLQNAHDRT